ncbi:hypothetical protein K4F52_002847 [Lecanicillium sp. MT-2017a]|nr:hypothetical protein K4F52_002847 [Lecanicillium sp. MT-2017a]
MAASFSNSSMPMSTAAPSDKGFPAMVGDFKFFGCLTGKFADLKNMASDPKMDLNLCAASCPSEFMGVVGKDCFCGDKIDMSATKKEDKSKCNTPCPGNKEQMCGGTGMSKRAVPEGAAVSVYQRVQGTRTTTITSTHVGTITSCAPTVTNCPIGRKTHGVVTKTVAICPAPKWHAEKIICCGNFCAPEYPCQGPHCVNHRVICEGEHCRTEVCDTEDWHKLVICKGGKCHYSQCQGDECGRKIVCYNGVCVREECYANECDNNMMCKGKDCGWEVSPKGEDSKKLIICDVNGQNCKHVQPAPKPEPAPGPKPRPDNNDKGKPNGNDMNNKPKPGPNDNNKPKPGPNDNGKPMPKPNPDQGAKPTGMPIVTGGVAKQGVSFLAAALGLVVFA